MSTPLMSIAGAVLLMAAARPTPVLAQDAVPEKPAGIYLQKGTADLVEVAMARLTETKTPGMAKYALTQGLTKLEYRGVVAGATAALKTSSVPVFIFVFERGAPQKPGDAMDFAALARAMSGTMPFGVTLPSEFELVRLTPKGDTREFSMGKAGRRTKGVERSQDALDVTVEEVRTGVFRVRPNAALEAGEYAFFVKAQLTGSPIWSFTADATGTR